MSRRRVEVVDVLAASVELYAAAVAGADRLALQL